MDLFDQAENRRKQKEAPLAARMRPRTLAEFIGQQEIIGPGRLLRRAVESDRLFSSILLWGPPGCGKTTLARIIANSTRSPFASISAVLDGLAELRKIVATAKDHSKYHGGHTTLFVDEVHRWNKAQQDALLPHVEDGTFVLVGATTENPYFEVNSALVSRSRIFQMKALSEQEIEQVLQQALDDSERGYGKRQVVMEAQAIRHLVQISGGDARNALNALELAVESTPPDSQGQIRIDLATAQESIQQRAVLYDKDGDAHYDTISAFIKSVRGSDPDAALYWLAKMLYAGESPRFIMRRLLILASEDIGLADPMGLMITNAAAQAFEFVGMPEGVYHLAEATLYLATAPKSNSTNAYFKAWQRVMDSGKTEVPLHLRDSNRDGPALGHGRDYRYPHEFNHNHVGQQYLPDALLGTYFYNPGDEGYEKKIQARLQYWRQIQEAALGLEKTEIVPDLSEEALKHIKYGTRKNTDKP